MKKTMLRQLLMAALLLGPGTNLFAGEGEDLLNAKDAANARGYGRGVSLDFDILMIGNQWGGELTLRDSLTDQDRGVFNRGSATYEIPLGEDFQVSLNGGGNSDDLVIRNCRGFVEYKADHRSILGVKHANVWMNLLTWTGSFWQLSTALDSVSGNKAWLVPWADGRTIKVMVKKSANGFGRKISDDFKVLRLENKSGKELPLLVSINGQGRDDGKLPSGSSRDYLIAETELISLNGPGNQDNIKINDDKGYIELEAARVEGLENGNIWINHFWWNSGAEKWYGSMSKTSINGNKNMILSALEGTQANKLTGVISKGDPLLFTIMKQ